MIRNLRDKLGLCLVQNKYLGILDGAKLGNKIFPIKTISESS